MTSVFFGNGLLAGIPLWEARTRLGLRGMYSCSAGIQRRSGAWLHRVAALASDAGPVGLRTVLLLGTRESTISWTAAYDGSSVARPPSRRWWVITYSKIVLGLRCHRRRFRARRGGRARPRHLAARTATGAERPSVPGRGTSSAHHRRDHSPEESDARASVAPKYRARLGGGCRGSAGRRRRRRGWRPWRADRPVRPSRPISTLTRILTVLPFPFRPSQAQIQHIFVRSSPIQASVLRRTADVRAGAGFVPSRK